MGTFKYKARSQKGTVEGTIEAENQSIAVSKLNSEGLYPITLKEDHPRRQKSGFSFFDRVKKQEVLTFTQEIADLIKAGLQIVEAIEVVEGHLKPSRFKNIVKDVKESMKKGASLSSSLEQYPDVFSPFYISLVQSGEMAGLLDQTLERIADNLEKEDDLRSKVRTAMAYPSLIAIVGVLTIAVLLIFVIPKLGVMFEDMGQSLPLITRIIMGFGSLFGHYWWILMLLLIGVSFLFIQIKKNPKTKLWMDRIYLSTPLVSQLNIKIAVYNLARSLGTLLKHGVPILQAIEALSKSQENLIIKKELERMGKAIHEGHSLGDELKKITFFPESFGHMVQIGEKSGRLDQSLLRTAEIYEKQADRQIKIVTSLLEPLMIVGLGSVLGVMVIGMLLPIFEMNIFVN